MIRVRANSADPAGMGLRDDDLFEPLVAANRLVGSCLVQALSVDAPLTLAKLEECRGMAPPRELVKRARIEMDADQGQQKACLPVACPDHFVMPLGRLPALAFGRI